MEQLTSALGSPVFWLGTVIGGLILHVLGHFAYRWTEKWLAASSSWWRARSERRTQMFDKAVRELAADENSLTYARHCELRLRLQSLSLLLMSLMLLVFSIVIGERIGIWGFETGALLAGLFGVAASMGAHLMAQDLRQKCDAVQDHR